MRAAQAMFLIRQALPGNKSAATGASLPPLRFPGRWWGTFRQWTDLGCTVKKRPDDVEPGHWGASVVLYRPFTKTVENDNGQQEEQEFIMMRTFTVFSADQVEGRWPRRLQVKDEPTTGNVCRLSAPAEELIAASAADIRHRRRPCILFPPVPEVPGRIIGMATISASPQSIGSTQ